MAEATNSPTPRAGVDLDKMSVAELTALRDAAEAKRLEKLESAKAAVLAETRAKLAELGLTLEGVLPPAGLGQGRKAPKDSGGDKLPAKYRGPNGEEWSGRGRLPRWLAALEAEGKKRDQFAVKA
jgi:DNA-binding protein H-NS